MARAADGSEVKAVWPLVVAEEAGASEVWVRAAEAKAVREVADNGKGLPANHGR
jgi:hypothetical protein